MIENIRRSNMLTLLTESNGLANLSRRLDRSPSQVSQLVYGLKSSQTGRRRGMRSEITLPPLAGIILSLEDKDTIAIFTTK